MKTKLDKLKACAAAGDWHGALCIAARFHKLGEHRRAITRAWDAIQSPRFYEEIGKSPSVLVEEGCTALRERYKL